MSRIVPRATRPISDKIDGIWSVVIPNILTLFFNFIILKYYLLFQGFN